jgi:glycosyltransferase involved in cell wall biosynthesis
MLFTVIIPTLNEEKNIGNLLKDLKRQTFRDFEVIVVDGKSHDKTADIVLSCIPEINISLKTSRIRNAGYQRNIGAKAGHGDFLIFLDADSRIASDFLKKIKQAIDKNSNLSIAACWIKPDTHTAMDRMIAKLYNYAILNQYVKPSANATGLIIKKQIFLKFNGFKPGLTFAEDRDLIARTCKAGYKAKILKKPVLTFSFRRFRKYGYTSTISKLVYLNLYSIIMGAPSSKKTNYKMGGD